MKLITYRQQGRTKLGLRLDGGVLDLEAAAISRDEDPAEFTPERFFAAGVAALPALQRMEECSLDQGARLLPEDTLQLAPAAPRPGKIICIGLNYRGHAAETGSAIPEQPVLFSKFSNSLAASGEPVALPAGLYQYDYEAELVAVIGRRARYVQASAALDHVLGYCNGNDLSCRDVQFLTGQWLVGKTLDGFMPLGPWLVTADEVADPQNLDVGCWVNGERRQASNTSDMIFSVAELVAYISRFMTLEPGDVISTGTPSGVALGMNDDPLWLRPGDEVRVEVEGLGSLVTPLVAEERPS